MTTTPILGITQVAPNQTGKEAVINTAIGALESATNGTLAVPISTADVILSQAQFLSAMLFKVTGLTAPRSLLIPSLINGVNTLRVFAVRNSSTFGLTVMVNGSAGTAVSIPPGNTRLVDVDGAGNVAVLSQGNAFNTLSDAPGSYTGKAKNLVRVNAAENGVEFWAADYMISGFAASSINNSEVLIDHLVTRAFTFAPNFAGCLAGCGTNPLSNFVMIVQQNGTNIGTITISSTGVVTFATTGGAAFPVAVGDLIAIIAPASGDPNILRVRFSLKGN